jgi:hypothetical protein
MSVAINSRAFWQAGRRRARLRRCAQALAESARFIRLHIQNDIGQLVEALFLATPLRKMSFEQPSHSCSPFFEERFAFPRFELLRIP